MTDRSILEKRLLVAERRVSEGADRIKSQREILNGVRDNDELYPQAAAVLESLLHSQQRFVNQRDGLVAELTALNQKLATND